MASRGLPTTATDPTELSHASECSCEVAVQRPGGRMCHDRCSLYRCTATDPKRCGPSPWGLKSLRCAAEWHDTEAGILGRRWLWLWCRPTHLQPCCPPDTAVSNSSSYSQGIQVSRSWNLGPRGKYLRRCTVFQAGARDRQRRTHTGSIRLGISLQLYVHVASFRVRQRLLQDNSG